MCWAYGWGSTGLTGGSGFLKQVELEIGSSEECDKEYGKITREEYAICAGKRVGHDTCTGDRLDPVVFAYRVEIKKGS